MEKTFENKSDNSFEELLEKFTDKKIKISVPGINQQSDESLFSENINPEAIRINNVYWFDKSDLNKRKSEWTKIVVTCVRSGVIFYKETENPSSEEKFILENSLAIRLGFLQPIEYVVDTKKFPTEYFEFVSRCPFTKIVYK